MTKYKLILVERLEKTVEVEAENIEAAKNIAWENYKKALPEYILTADNFTSIDIMNNELSSEIIFSIANWLVNTGYKNTMSGNYHITFEETASHFNLPVNVIIENARNIADIIDRNKKILSETWIDEDFDMNFVGDFDD